MELTIFSKHIFFVVELGQAALVIVKWAPTMHPPFMYKKKPPPRDYNKYFGCTAKIINSPKLAQ